MNTKTNSPSSLKFVVIGGTGLIGKPVVARLRDLGHAVVVAAPSQGINTVTGEGLAAAFAGAHTVIDVSNSPSFEDAAVLDFFTRSTRNLLTAARTAGVRHVAALSVVGTERMTSSGYFRAKLEQETQIKASPLPYTILRATQFFEFAGGIAAMATTGTTVRLAPALMQPVAAADVSAAVVEVALAAPRNGTAEIAGPASIPQDAFVRRFLEITGDPRKVVTAPVPYFGNIPLNDQTLRPGANPMLGTTTYETWLAAYAEKARLAARSAAV